MDPKKNRLGFEMAPYRGGKTTLCAGCGHNAISERIIEAFFEMGVDPRQVVKLSGIGCSSKSPAYFLGGSHGFNSVHGRMPSVGTGAMLANRKLIAIGISGDGDTGAIGIGQFVHLMRRNVPLIYVIEDNGCYGLTKGQFSPTADVGSVLKNGIVNDLQPIDSCMLAIQLGASFVARSFSGDKKQLLSILKASLGHRGTCMIDVISPCVTFNDHEGSTKSYAYAKEHDEVLGDISFVPYFEDISIEYDPGTTTQVTLHDGSKLYLKKVAENYDPTDKLAAMQPAARNVTSRRVRDRRPLRRAGQRRLRDAAQPGGRTVVDPAAHQGAARTRSARTIDGISQMKKLALLAFAAFLAASPAIAEERELSVDDIYNLKDVRDPQRSPDGKWVAFVVSRAIKDTDKNDTDVWMANWDGGTGDPVDVDARERIVAPMEPRQQVSGIHLIPAGRQGRAGVAAEPRGR